MTFEPGRILLVHYPFTDATAAKLRPVLVVSRMEFNNGEDVVVLPISSRISENERYGYPILDDQDFFVSTKLKYPSTVKWSKPMTIHESVITRKLGILPSEVLADIIDRLRRLF